MKYIFDDMIRSLAWKLPRRLAYWCAIRVACNATQGRYGNQAVPDLRMMDALKRWEKPNG